MKIVITLLSFSTGGWMLFDGIYCLIKGKYFGPAKPGPWANLFFPFNIDVFKLSPMFIVFGIAWLTFIVALWTNQSWTYLFGITISICTLWFLPIGTIVSITILIMLLTAKTKLGL